MRAIIGLGNPGARYAADRHNIGFRVVERLAQHGGAPAAKVRHQALVTQIQLDSQPVLLVQPQTYMNLSGQAVVPLCHAYSITPEQVLVIHDELDLPFGQLKLKQSGGDGGHRGLRSISAEMQTPAYARLRFGIGRPEDESIAIADFVLSPFSPPQETQLPLLLARCVEMAESWCRDGIVAAMNQWNRSLPPLAPSE